MAKEKIEILIDLDDGNVKKVFSGINKNSKQTSKSIEGGLLNSFKKLQDRAGGVLNKFLNLRNLFAGGIAIAGLSRLIGQFAEFEDALIGVGKTTDIVGEELEKIGDNFLKLSQVIPTTAAELARIGEVAGQLGISSSDNILKFTETIARLDAAVTGISVRELAIQLAKISDLTGDNISTVDQLGASLVSLGNNFAANEGEIASNALEISKATAVFGIASSSVLALATAFKASGIEAQVSRTAVLKTFTAFRKASGKELKTLVDLLGLTNEQFRDLQQNNPEKLFVQLVNSLSRLSGTDAANTLDAIGLSEIRVSSALQALSANVDNLNSAFGIAERGFKENTALIEESNRAFASLSNRFQIFRNNLNKLIIDLGKKLQPTLVVIIDSLNSLVNALPEVIARISRLTVVVGTLTTAFLVLKNTTKILAFLGAIPKVLAGVRIAFTSTTAVVGLYTTTANSARIATVAFTRAMRVARGVATLGLAVALDSIINKYVELKNLEPLEKINRETKTLANQLRLVQQQISSGVERVAVKGGRIIESAISEGDLKRLEDRKKTILSQLNDLGQRRIELTRQSEDGVTKAAIQGQLDRGEVRNSALENIIQEFDPQVQIEALRSVFNERLAVITAAREREILSEQRFAQVRLNLETGLQKGIKEIQDKFISEEQVLAQQRVDQFASTIRDGFVNSIASIGSALANQKDPSKAFFAGILNTVGDFAIQYGVLVSGIGKASTAVAAALSNPFTGGGIAVFAGLALIALGGALKGFASSIQTGGFAAAGSGGSSPSETLPELGEPGVAEQQQDRATEINVKVEGSLVDPRGTAEAISELLTDISRSNGIIVNA